MSIPILLTKMTKLVMEHILEYLEFPSILVLRKVCHDLRNFIDDAKPACRLTRIRFNVNPESISFALWFDRQTLTGSSMRVQANIDFVKNEEGCLIKWDKKGEVKKTIVNDEDFIAIFCKDFDILLRYQKTVLEDFGIMLKIPNLTVKKRVLDSINKSLNSMDHLLQVKKIKIGLSRHEEIMLILPYIDSKSMKTIQIIDFLSQNHFLNLNEIGQLEQWKQADELSVDGFQLTDLPQNLKHFSRIYLYLREVSTEVLITLKKIFLCSSTLATMNIHNYGNLSQDVIRQRLIKSYGQPCDDRYDIFQDTNWFFKIPDTNQFLKIKLEVEDNYINFDRIEQSDVPQNAIILN